jgi:hypothetical protein
VVCGNFGTHPGDPLVARRTQWSTGALWCMPQFRCMQQSLDDCQDYVVVCGNFGTHPGDPLVARRTQWSSGALCSEQILAAWGHLYHPPANNARKCKQCNNMQLLHEYVMIAGKWLSGLILSYSCTVFARVK